MLTKERRPLTGAERKIVQEALADFLKLKGWRHRFADLFPGLGCGLLLGSFSIFLPLVAWGWVADLLHRPVLSPTTYTYQVFCSVGGLLGAILAGRVIYQNNRETRREAENLGQMYQGYLEAGEAEVWHCDTSRVVEWEEYDDEGPGFLLELAPGQVLFLQGSYLYDYGGVRYEDEDDPIIFTKQSDPGVWPPPPSAGLSPDNRVFPCRQFDLVYAPNSRMLLNLACLGERFEKWSTYTPNWEMFHKMNRYPEDGDILPVSLDTLPEDLMRWAAQKEQAKP